MDEPKPNLAHARSLKPSALWVDEELLGAGEDAQTSLERLSASGADPERVKTAQIVILDLAKSFANLAETTIENPGENSSPDEAALAFSLAIAKLNTVLHSLNKDVGDGHKISRILTAMSRTGLRNIAKLCFPKC